MHNKELETKSVLLETETEIEIGIGIEIEIELDTKAYKENPSSE